MSDDQLYAAALSHPFDNREAFSEGRFVLDVPSNLVSFRRLHGANVHPSSLDSVAAACWKHGRSARDMLRFHAEVLLDPYRSPTALRLNRDHPGQEILKWRQVSLKMPAAHLTMALRSATPMEQLGDVRILDASMAPSVPTAHLHVHAGAAWPFEAVWTRLCSTLRRQDLEQIAKIRETPAPLDGWAQWLIRAALTRRYLGSSWFGTTLTWDEHTLVKSALSELICGQLRQIVHEPHRSADEVRLARNAHHGGTLPPPATLYDIWRADPIGSGKEVWPEGRLLRYGMQNDDRLPDTERRLFWQYIRLRTMFHQFLVADEKRPGLAAFTKVYERIRGHRADLEDTHVAGHHLCSDPPLNMQSIELRTAPPKSTQALVRMVTQQAPELELALADGIEWGWILHFIRYAGPQRLDGGGWVPEYHRLYRDALNTEEVLRRTLYKFPELLCVIRGLDIAGDELAGPLWLIVPSLDALRRHSRELASQSEVRRLAGGRSAALGVTLHAGEDFPHLLSGLRSVHEPLAWGIVGRGDRLGHALALGTDPTTWVNANPAVKVKRGQRLFDLAWALHIVARSPAEFSTLQASWLFGAQAQLRSITTEVFGVSRSMEEVVAAWEALGRPDSLRTMGLHEKWPATDLAPPLALLAELFSQTNAWRSSEEWLEIKTQDDVPLLKAMQRWLLHRVSRSGIGIELNPSSNYLVGALNTLVDQPSFRLRPLDPKEPSIAISLNADDPLSFATKLSDEFAYAWAGMVAESGLSAGYVMEHLEAAARSSWSQRFTLPVSKDLSKVQVPDGHHGRRVWWHASPRNAAGETE